MADFKDLMSRVSIETLIGERYGVHLIKDGNEFKACCPFHDEKTPSFTVNPVAQLFHCFGCGASGDHLNFIKQWESCDIVAAGKILEEFVGGGVAETKPAKLERLQRSKPDRENWQPIVPAPAEAIALLFPNGKEKRTGKIFNPKRKGEKNEWTTFAPERVYQYSTADGLPVGFVLRVIINGKKITPTVTYCENKNTNEKAWAIVAFPEPRPLYGLPSLSKKGTVFLSCEGEKVADYVAEKMPKAPALAWPGGSNGIRFVDWEPLRGRKVAILRDNDPEALAAADGYFKEDEVFVEGVAQYLEKIGCEVKIVEPPADKEKGWDCADEPEWDRAALLEYIKNGMRDPKNFAKHEEPPALQNDDDIPPPADWDYVPPIEGNVPEAGGDPFRFLGFNKGPNGSNVHYFMANTSRQVLSLTAGSMSKNNLLELAPLLWWEQRYPAKGAAAFDMDMAVNFLLQRSSATGIYDPGKTRGRGAWWDSGRPVVHLGSEVIVDGERFAVENVQSRFVYELSNDLPVSLANPLPASEAAKLVRICELISWEKPVNSKLLSGWIMCAIVCGALKWRPHIWVTGSAGSGKSTVMDLILARALGEMALYVQGETSEAGIRQTLGSDALPVIFDEAESERKSSAQRMDNVLALVTQASSDSSASIIKGTAGGKALSYKIRSCFAFSSVAVNLKQHAARSRVTVLGVRINRAPNAREQFDELCAMITETLTDDYVSRLHSRAIHLMPVIRKNAETFSKAGATSDALGSKRMGDQIGALLAGCYALHSNNEITEEAARKWIGKQDWSEERGQDEQSDEIGCLSYIMETSNPAAVGHSKVDRTIGELVAIAAKRKIDDDVTGDQADDALRRIGIKVDGREGFVFISNTHHALGKILREKPWENSWPRTLSRIEGSRKTESPVRFGSGVQSRAVAIPLPIIFGADIIVDEF